MRLASKLCMLVVACLGAALSVASPAIAATVRGALVEMHGDAASSRTSPVGSSRVVGSTYAIRQPDGGLVELRRVPQQSLPTVLGDPVVARGTLRNGTLSVRTLKARHPRCAVKKRGKRRAHRGKRCRTAPRRRSVRAVGAAGSKLLAVVPVVFAGGERAPVDAATLNDWVFAGGMSLRSYYDIASAGALRLEGRVYEPVTLDAGHRVCGSLGGYSQAVRQTLEARGEPLDATTYLMLILPEGSACGGSTQGEALNGSRTEVSTDSWIYWQLSGWWYEKDPALHKLMRIRVMAHELNHNFGLWHATYVPCLDRVSPLLNTEVDCYKEQLDVFDTMGTFDGIGGGNGGLVMPSVFNRSRLGWVAPADFPTITTAGYYTLRAPTAPAGARGLLGIRIPVRTVDPSAAVPLCGDIVLEYRGGLPATATGEMERYLQYSGSPFSGPLVRFVIPAKRAGRTETVDWGCNQTALASYGSPNGWTSGIGNAPWASPSLVDGRPNGTGATISVTHTADVARPPAATGVMEVKISFQGQPPPSRNCAAGMVQQGDSCVAAPCPAGQTMRAGRCTPTTKGCKKPLLQRGASCVRAAQCKGRWIRKGKLCIARAKCRKPWIARGNVCIKRSSCKGQYRIRGAKCVRRCRVGYTWRRGACRKAPAQGTITPVSQSGSTRPEGALL